jgi:hypothetical protein
MAPPPGGGAVECDAESLVWSLLGALNAEDSEAEVHGDGSGFRGDIMDADVDKLGTVLVPKDGRPLPTIGIFRLSNAGLRNSDGRRCLGELMQSERHSTLHEGLLFLSKIPGDG